MFSRRYQLELQGIKRRRCGNQQHVNVFLLRLVKMTIYETYTTTSKYNVTDKPGPSKMDCKKHKVKHNNIMFTFSKYYKRPI